MVRPPMSAAAFQGRRAVKPCFPPPPGVPPFCAGNPGITARRVHRFMAAGLVAVAGVPAPATSPALRSFAPARIRAIAGGS